MIDKLKETLSFKGRMNRKQFLMQSAIIFVSIMVSVGITASLASIVPEAAALLLVITCLLMYIICSLILIAATVKRLHDLGFTGYWMLIQIIPIVGIVFSLGITVWPGQKTENRFGPVPGKSGEPPAKLAEAKSVTVIRQKANAWPT